MSNNADNAVEKIVSKSMEAYGLRDEKPKPAATDFFDDLEDDEEWTRPAPRRQTYKPAYKPAQTRRVTSKEDYEKMVPAIKTPSVFSKAKVDELLLQCRELPTPDKPQKNYAGYSRKEWDTLVDVVAKYLLDVVEGAGLECKGIFFKSSLREDLSLTLQKHFNHRDPYDQVRRMISVDGRIDSDERKP